VTMPLPGPPHLSDGEGVSEVVLKAGHQWAGATGDVASPPPATAGTPSPLTVARGTSVRKRPSRIFANSMRAAHEAIAE
jgi:hypothetical protein